MQRGRHSAWPLAGLLVFIVLIFLPSVWFFAAAVAEQIVRLLSGQGVDLVLSHRLCGVFARSVALAGGGALVALVLGVATGYLTTRVAVRGRRVLFILLLAPFFLPGYIYGTAWTDIVVPRMIAAGTPGMAVDFPLWWAAAALGLYLFPWVHLVAGTGFASIEGHLEDGARMAMGGLRRFGRISLPLVAGLLASVGLFSFVIGLKEHNIALLFRQNVFAKEIMMDYQMAEDRTAALKGLVCILTALAALGLAAWVALRRRRIVIEGISAPWRPPTSGQPISAVAPLVALTVFTAAVVLPLAVIVFAADGWSNYRVVWLSAWPQVIAGLATAAATATVCTALGYLLAEQIARSSRPVAALIVAALFVLFALPAPVLDIGLIQLWNRPGPMGLVYDSPAMLVLGQTVSFLPIAVVGFSVARRRIDPQLIEAAEIGGLRPGAVVWRIVWPMLLPWLFGVWLVVLVLSLNDAESAVLLAAAGHSTLSVRIMTLLHYAPEKQVAALCVIQVATTALAVGAVAATVLGWRRLHSWAAERRSP